MIIDFYTFSYFFMHFPRRKYTFFNFFQLVYTYLLFKVGLLFLPVYQVKKKVRGITFYLLFYTFPEKYMKSMKK